MVVVAVGGSAGAGAHSGWGTWEELILGSAVLRHGGATWSAVADELRSRSPCVFSPEDCEVKFAEIQSRYSASNAWFEELRKQRVAELKRDLEKSDSCIRSLQSVIESLSNSKDGDGSSDCRATHTESRPLSGNVADNNSSSKELSRDRSSAASITEEASHCQKPQQVQQCDTDSMQTNNTSTEESCLKAIDEKVCAKDSLFWGSRKQRDRRVRGITMKADASSRDSGPTSTSCIERDGSSECCKEDMKKGLGLKASNVEYGAMKKGLKTSNVEPDAMKKGLKTPNVEPGVMKKGLTIPRAESAVMKKGSKSPKLESVVMTNGLATPKLESDVMKNSLKTPKLESFVMKNSLKTPKGESGVSVIEREKVNLLGILNFISSQVDSLMLQRQVDVQRKRVGYKKMIRRHMDFRILYSKINSGMISSTKELLRDILVFVNNVIAFYPRATLEHKSAVQLRDLAYKTVNESTNYVSKTASAPIAKKNARAMQPGRHGPGDVKGNKVSSRDATASARQVGKGSRNDKLPAANLETVRKSEAAKKRGVGRPRKSGPLKGSAPAQEGRGSGRQTGTLNWQKCVQPNLITG